MNHLAPISQAEKLNSSKGSQRNEHQSCRNMFKLRESNDNTIQELLPTLFSQTQYSLNDHNDSHYI